MIASPLSSSPACTKYEPFATRENANVPALEATAVRVVAPVVASTSRSIVCRGGPFCCVRLLYALTMPQPYESLRVVPGGRVANCSMRDLSCTPVNPGFCASNRAAIPETYGADADVPYPNKYVSSFELKSHPGPSTPPPPLSSKR